MMSPQSDMHLVVCLLSKGSHDEASTEKDSPIQLIGFCNSNLERLAF